MSDNLAARDLRLRSISVSSFSSRIHEAIDVEAPALLVGLEETKRAEDAVTGFDQVVAGEARQRLELRDERLVDLS